MWIGIIIGWIILSILAGIGARNKGRSFAGFFFLSLLLSPLIGLIAMAVVKPIKKEEASAETAAESTTPTTASDSEESEIIPCPNCGKPKKRGEMCPNCGSWQS